jgi:hypothetical protein
MIPHPELNTPPVIPPVPLRALVHDLRQPLSVIETCTYCLRVMLQAKDARVLEQLDRIEEQVFEAGLILLAAVRPPAADHPSRGPDAAESLSRTNAQSAAAT